eukprot:3063349-Pyramimonas_sp.AAC.1
MANRMKEVLANVAAEYADLQTVVDNYNETKGKPGVKRTASDPISPPKQKTSKTDDDGDGEDAPDSQVPQDSQMPILQSCGGARTRTLHIYYVALDRTEGIGSLTDMVLCARVPNAGPTLA